MAKIWDPDRGQISVPGPLTGGSSVIVGVQNLVGTRDPLTTDDVTTGVAVGGEWFNSTAGKLRYWTCYSNTQGAASWIFSGADYTNGGTNPATEVTAFGNQTSAVMAEEGNINRQVFGVAVAPGSTGNDNVLAVFTLPANAFDVSGRGIAITASGSLGANSNNKRIKIIYGAAGGTVGSAVTGGTVIADTGTVTTNGSGWTVSADVYKYGALASNTQLALHTQSQVGGTVTPLIAPTTLTATESSAIIICVTGNATTATPDIGLNFVQVNGMN